MGVCVVPRWCGWQVVITASDDARLNSVGLVHVDRRSSIRRVTVGGVSGSSIVFA